MASDCGEAYLTGRSEAIVRDETSLEGMPKAKAGDESVGSSSSSSSSSTSHPSPLVEGSREWLVARRDRLRDAVRRLMRGRLQPRDAVRLVATEVGADVDVALRDCGLLSSETGGREEADLVAGSMEGVTLSAPYAVRCILQVGPTASGGNGQSDGPRGIEKGTGTSIQVMKLEVMDAVAGDAAGLA